MTHARARLALVAIMAAAALGGAAPATADAFVSWYNCASKPPYQWCDGRANGSFDGLHSWDYNKAHNPGGPSMVVCQGVYRPSTGVWSLWITCGANEAAYIYGNVTCACFEANVYHQYSSSRNISGFADASYVP